MGGKHKQAQRIKNNARPSNSGRSAELLASSSSISQFSSVKEIRFIPPTLSLLKTEEFDASVSPDFQIVFKKMNKRDATTKLKALQEFADLIANTDVEAIKTIVAFWSSLYNNLATDTDHRVREAAHNSHLQIILKDKKLIAPYLKQVIGPWFTSQYDTYAPAASAALKSFHSAFPPYKVQDCVVFGQKEILTYVSDNLQSKIDAKLANNDEAEAKFERILVSSLLGYCLFLNTVNEEQIVKNDELHRKIVDDPTFIKLATNKSNLIRAAWFQAIATIYHKAKFLLTDQNRAIVPLVFSNLDEKEPGVVRSVWEAVLLIMDGVDEWHKFVNFDKQCVNKLNAVLREGGNGNATVIYPNLLSLLAKLPDDANAKKFDVFYDNFFKNLLIGLRKRTVTASKSESGAIVTALVECLKYVVINNKENELVCTNLIEAHLISLIKWSLLEKQISYRVVFSQISGLLQYFSANEELTRYAKVLWTCLNELFQTIQVDEDGREDYFERQVIFLQYLKIQPKQKEAKVKFLRDDDEASGGAKAEKCRNVKDCSENGKVYNEELINLVYTVLKSYTNFIEETKNRAVLQQVCFLVQLFKSKDFLLELSKQIKKDSNGKLIDIYNNFFNRWLNTDELCIEAVVDLCFILFEYLCEGDATMMLNSFLQFADRNCFGWFIKNALSHPYNENVQIQAWIKNKEISECLLKATEINLQSDCPPEQKTLFKLAFTINANNELLINEETVKEIINKLYQALLNPHDFLDTIDACARLASFVSETIYTEDLLLKCGDDLILSLFKFSLIDITPFVYTLTDDTLWEVTTTWEDALTILAENLDKSELLKLIGKLSEIVEKNFLASFKSETQIKRLTAVVTSLIRPFVKNVPQFVDEILRIVFKTEFYAEWRLQVNELCMRAEYLSGNLCAPFEDFRRECKLSTEDDILKYFVWRNLIINVLASNPNENNDDEEEEEMDSCFVVFFVADCVNVLLEFLGDISLSASFTNNFQMVEHYEIISYIKIYMEENVKKVLVPNMSRYGAELKEKLVEKLQCDSWAWSKCPLIFNELFSESVPFEFYAKQCCQLSKLHLIQQFGTELDFDSVHYFDSNVACNAIILRSLLHCTEIDVQIAEVFDGMKKLRSRNIPKFLHVTNNLTWIEGEEINEAIRLYAKLVEMKFDDLNQTHWDFGVISLTSWASNCYKLRECVTGNEQFQTFILAVCNYYASLNRRMNQFKRNHIRNNYVDEWDDLLCANIQCDLIQIWFDLANRFDVKFDNCELMIYLPFLQQFGNVIEHFTWKTILNKDNNPSNNLPNWNKILSRCFSLLKNETNTVLQLWGYEMMNVLLPGLIQFDLEALNATSTKRYVIEQFLTVLEDVENLVNVILQEFKLGEDSCLVKPFTASYTYVFAYLLLWNSLLNFCQLSSPELRYQYADLLKNKNVFKYLMNNLFKLMPAEIIHNSEMKSKECAKLYEEKPVLSMNAQPTSELLEHFVCWVYAKALAQLPALVRQWWSETDAKISQIVERVTSNYVSPQLCQRELMEIGQHDKKFKNMTIKTISNVREVVAIYTVDESQMELVITLPQNYPLGGPDVKCNRQIGGPQHKWLMQLKKCLLHQNGRIWDGLLLWNSNLDKKFDGVEECYICFSVLHPGTYQLPKLTCQTCKKKFHSPCLYKWFSTSNKSSCPICRNLF